MFGDYLDPLTEQGYRLLLVDQRAQGRSDGAPQVTWSLGRMAEDVVALGRSLRLERYAVLGHSYGAFVALQNAVDFPGLAAQTIVSSGLPSARYLEQVWRNLEAFEPEEVRDQVTRSWEREPDAATQDDVASLLHDQLPFQFGDPRDRRIAEFERRTAGAVFAPEVLSFFARQEYGGIEVEDRLGELTQPVLVLGGELDRTCVAEAVQAMARRIPLAELHVFEASGHMTYVEANERYLEVVRAFLDRHREG
jgi:proline iminopeptidase